VEVQLLIVGTVAFLKYNTLMKNTDIKLFSLCLIFFITSCIGIKIISKAVFQHIPTEIDDLVIDKSQNLHTFEVSDEGKKWVDSVYNAMTFDEK
jgi:hypothetical protein